MKSKLIQHKHAIFLPAREIKIACAKIVRVLLNLWRCKKKLYFASAEVYN